MSNVKSVVVGDTTFNIAQCTAPQQMELWTILGAVITRNAATSGAEEIDRALLVGALTVFPLDKMDHICGLILPKVFISGRESSCDIKDFQGKIATLYQVLAEAVKLNLDDFFTFILKDQSNANQKSQEGKAAQI